MTTQDPMAKALDDALRPIAYGLATLPDASYEKHRDMILDKIRADFDNFRTETLQKLANDLFDLRMNPEEGP